MAKEVGTKKKTSSREASFGSAPSAVGLENGGDMEKFGHQVRSGVWPPAATSVDQKSGFPKSRKM